MTPAATALCGTSLRAKENLLRVKLESKSDDKEKTHLHKQTHFRDTRNRRVELSIISKARFLKQSLQARRRRLRK